MPLNLSLLEGRWRGENSGIRMEGEEWVDDSDDDDTVPEVLDGEEEMEEVDVYGVTVGSPASNRARLSCM